MKKMQLLLFAVTICVLLGSVVSVASAQAMYTYTNGKTDLLLTFSPEGIFVYLLGRAQTFYPVNAGRDAVLYACGNDRIFLTRDCKTLLLGNGSNNDTFTFKLKSISQMPDSARECLKLCVNGKNRERRR